MTGTHITQFNLGLDSSCVFLPAERDADHSSCVTGTLQFHLSQPIWVKGIKVALRGNLRLPRGEFSIWEPFHEAVTLQLQHQLAASRTLSSFRLPAGKYQFPFEIPVSKYGLETLTGPSHEYHTYQVDGIIERKFSKDAIVSQPVRIYRSFDLEEMERWQYSSPCSIEKQWDGKIQYSVTIPDQNMPFGSTFPVEFWFAPLTKGLKIERIRIQIIERHELKIIPTAAEAVQYNLRFFKSNKKHTVLSGAYYYDDSTADAQPLEDELCTIKSIRLPQRLHECTQNMDSGMIKIDHELIFSVELRNADGHLSMISGVMPIYIHMSPTVITKDGAVHGKDLQQLQIDQNPPPLYGDHLKDSMLVELSNICSQMGLEDAGNVPDYETAIRTVAVEH
ncbi:hypothetical protein ASPWEDRAFT_184195 [Aspergillus wentii DTO 134E9]|uniref:Arrestin C-terminal-like domain-containing protein n=1 Tax=Aspergillus wentii DTO 134E9 TaxID=1073089 RepID=A0A1L9RMT6_ASPWE|nr:uncharacterized protein ASPWEDRAFT_184195 [Aspergillus wentii DTO 134E9]KAI9929307.1 hypothetical protein MW887_000774 [Aspergillus wentii]OJJ36255.1 hypothetical protein ASPWEDRAFT_184195 [Aspergillus wentii DTO 134E9]